MHGSHGAIAVTLRRIDGLSYTSPSPHFYEPHPSSPYIKLSPSIHQIHLRSLFKRTNKLKREMIFQLLYLSSTTTHEKFVAPSDKV
jgi:hypothetical protein